MTLIIYAKCNDATILISDRKETHDTGYGQSVKKYYLSKDNDFLLAFSGEGDGIDLIITQIEGTSEISANSIVGKLTSIVTNLTIPVRQGGRQATGCLIIKKESSIEFRDITVFSTMIAIPENDPPFKSIGDPAAASLADFLLRKSKISSDSWVIACQKMISIMKNVANLIETVGRLDLYGFDIFVFTNSGSVQYCKYEDAEKPEFGLDFVYHNPAVFFNMFTEKVITRSEGESR